MRLVRAARLVVVPARARAARAVRDGVHADALLGPDLALPVLGGLARRGLVLRDGRRALAVRGSAERVPDVRVEVERRGVRDDLRVRGRESEGGKEGGKEGCQRSGRWACVSEEGERYGIGDENDGAWRDGEMERWEMTIPASGSHDLLPSWRQAREGLVRFDFGGRAHGTRADASLRPGNEAPVHMHAGPLASPAVCLFERVLGPSFCGPSSICADGLVPLI